MHGGSRQGRGAVLERSGWGLSRLTCQSLMMWPGGGIGHAIRAQNAAGSTGRTIEDVVNNEVHVARPQRARRTHSRVGTISTVHQGIRRQRSTSGGLGGGAAYGDQSPAYPAKRRSCSSRVEELDGTSGMVRGSNRFGSQTWLEAAGRAGGSGRNPDHRPGPPRAPALETSALGARPVVHDHVSVRGAVEAAVAIARSE